MIPLYTPPPLWTPPKPAIIRAGSLEYGLPSWVKFKKSVEEASFPGVYPIPGTKPATVTLTDHVVDTTDTTSYTFTSRNIGPAFTTRWIIVGVVLAKATAISLTSLTIAGVTAGIHAVASQTSPNGRYLALTGAAIPTGTTATIVVTPNTSATRCGVAIWALSLAASTATDTGSDTDNSNPLSDTLNVNAGGVAVALNHYVAAALRTVTYAGLDEDFDEALESPDGWSAASKAFANAQSGLTVSTTPSGTTTSGLLVMASFR